MDRRMDGRMDGQTNKRKSPVFYRTLSPSGPLPCFPSLRFTIMESRATGIVDHILPSGDLFVFIVSSPYIIFKRQHVFFSPISVPLFLISRAFNPSKPLSTRTYQIPDSRLSSIFSAIFSISFCSLVYLLPLKYFFLLSLVSIFPSFHSSVCLISFLYSEAPLQRIRY